jgi:hypothetical protein
LDCSVLVLQFREDFSFEIVFQANVEESEIVTLTWCDDLLAGGDSGGGIHCWKIPSTSVPGPVDFIDELPEEPIPSSNQGIVPSTIRLDSFLQPSSDKVIPSKPKAKGSSKVKPKQKQQKLVLPTAPKAARAPKPKIVLESESVSDAEEDELDFFAGDADDRIEAPAPLVGGFLDEASDEVDEADLDEPSGDDVAIPPSFLGDDDDDPDDGIVENESQPMGFEDPVDFEEPVPTYASVDYGSSFTFMPGSTSEYVDGARLLCWNAWGSIVQRMDNLIFEKVEIRPSDISDFYASRVTDITGVIAATLDNNGYAIATRSAITYHDHAKSGQRADVTKEFGVVENIETIAIGKG